MKKADVGIVSAAWKGFIPPSILSKGQASSLQSRDEPDVLCSSARRSVIRHRLSSLLWLYLNDSCSLNSLTVIEAWLKLWLRHASSCICP